MHPDLERLITLQQLDTAASEARRRLADEPERERAFVARLDVARQAGAAAKERLGENQNARRAIEKDVAVQQGRLSKFRDQLMAVKTNVEYQAMQKEIEFAQAEVKKLEDAVLGRMLEADDLAAELKRAEAQLTAEQKAVDTDRKALAAELGAMKASLDRITQQRAETVASLDRQLLALFETISKRRSGVAVAEARDGICTICHVRLRPQVFNTVRRNDQIVQCDSCNRILYFTPVAPTAAPDNVSHTT
jgi:predicted  nucleic acid-binding Zn-ribbon protein